MSECQDKGLSDFLLLSILTIFVTPWQLAHSSGHYVTLDLHFCFLFSWSWGCICNSEHFNIDNHETAVASRHYAMIVPAITLIIVFCFFLNLFSRLQTKKLLWFLPDTIRQHSEKKWCCHFSTNDSNFVSGIARYFRWYQFSTYLSQMFQPWLWRIRLS